MIYIENTGSNIIKNFQPDTNNLDKAVILYSTEELKEFINQNPDKLVTVEIDIGGGGNGTTI